MGSSSSTRGKAVLESALCESDPHANGLAVGVHASIAPRLALGGADREDYRTYQANGGYETGASGPELVSEISSAGLLGRGGAAFPTATKLRALLAQTGPKYLVANGEEGEPASIKDRWLMRKRPHLVLDGLLRIATAIGAESAYIYVSDKKAENSIHRAIEERGRTPVPLKTFRVDPSYVAGEETSVVRAINGGPAKPTDKPPRPYQSGIFGRPTLVSNVETLANVPFISINGADAFRAAGTQSSSSGTVLITVTGACQRPGLYEVPLGLPLNTLLFELAGVQDGVRGYLMGGYFAGLLNSSARDLSISYQHLSEVGSGLGCGAIVVIGNNDCPMAASADVMAYFARENAGQCGACFRGTAAMSTTINSIALGQASEKDIDRLRGWSTSLRGRGACAALDGAAQLAATLLREFPEEIELHRSGSCPRCQSLISTSDKTRYAIGSREGANYEGKSQTVAL
jgi:NADH:ubiquinone oxidoreductase subunit F (NADH-binding)